MKRATNIPTTDMLNAVNAARNDPVKRPNRNGSFSIEVVKTISSILVSRSRTTAFAQKMARTKTENSERSATVWAMLYGESTFTFAGPNARAVSAKPKRKKIDAAAKNDAWRV